MECLYSNSETDSKNYYQEQRIGNSLVNIIVNIRKKLKCIVMVKPNTFIVHSQIQMLTRLDTILFEMIPRVIYSLEIILIFNYKA